MTTRLYRALYNAASAFNKVADAYVSAVVLLDNIDRNHPSHSVRARRTRDHFTAVQIKAHAIVAAICSINGLRECIKSVHATLYHDKRAHATLDDAVQADDGTIGSDLRHAVHASRSDATSASSPAATLNQNDASFLSSTQKPRAAESSNELLIAIVSQILAEEEDLDIPLALI